MPSLVGRNNGRGGALLVILQTESAFSTEVSWIMGFITNFVERRDLLHQSRRKIVFFWLWRIWNEFTFQTSSQQSNFISNENVYFFAFPRKAVLPLLHLIGKRPFPLFRWYKGLSLPIFKWKMPFNFPCSPLYYPFCQYTHFGREEASFWPI